MMIGVVGEHRFDVGNFAILAAVFPVMAVQAKIGWLFNQLFGIIRNMRIMAGETLPSCVERFVGYSSSTYGRFNPFMTGKTKGTIAFRS